MEAFGKELDRWSSQEERKAVWFCGGEWNERTFNTIKDDSPLEASWGILRNVLPKGETPDMHQAFTCSSGNDLSSEKRTRSWRCLENTQLEMPSDRTLTETDCFGPSPLDEVFGSLLLGYMGDCPRMIWILTAFPSTVHVYARRPILHWHLWKTNTDGG